MEMIDVMERQACKLQKPCVDLIITIDACTYSIRLDLAVNYIIASVSITLSRNKETGLMELIDTRIWYDYRIDVRVNDLVSTLICLSQGTGIPFLSTRAQRGTTIDVRLLMNEQR